jgi:protein phosphatase
VREANEDACAALPERGLFVVCDGMGGAAAGEVASHLASEAFLHSLSQQVPSRPRRVAAKSALSPESSGALSEYPTSHPHTRLEEAVRAANQAVFRHSRKSIGLHGMGTTLVAALLEEEAPPHSNGAGGRSTPALWLVHVGDSRCYRLSRGVLQQLTRDHSLVEEQLAAGVISRLQAAASPLRNIITRAVGSYPTVEPEITRQDLQPGDIYLLATDGLTRELEDDEIAQILSRSSTGTASTPALEAACKALVDAANRKGGRDNITVLLIACP